MTQYLRSAGQDQAHELTFTVSLRHIDCRNIIAINWRDLMSWAVQNGEPQLIGEIRDHGACIAVSHNPRERFNQIVGVGVRKTVNRSGASTVPTEGCRHVAICPTQ